jgi:5-methyltetrahydrofolate--homocysteine methyltransferase
LGEFRLSREAILERLKEAVIQFDISNVRQLAEEAVDQQVTPYEVVMLGMAKGMEAVGQKYQDGEYFLPELLMAAETFKEGMKALGPHLRPSDISPQGRVVIGTVEGDLHDIGKNIVSLMLEASGFEVFDLGVDVPADRFTKKAKEVSADVIAMSALLTTSFPQMQRVIEAERKSGIGAKTLVGGAPLNKDVAKSMGADGYGRDAVEGATICKQWITAKRQTPSGR